MWLVSNAAGSMTSGAATLTVSSSAALQSIAVSPASPSIAAGGTQQFTATGTYSDNSTKNITTSVTWKSSNAVFATIGATTGLATGVAAGTTQITATQGSIVSPNDPLTVTASTVTLQSIAVTPASPTVGIGNTVQFTATGTYSDNSTKKHHQQRNLGFVESTVRDDRCDNRACHRRCRGHNGNHGHTRKRGESERHVDCGGRVG